MSDYFVERPVFSDEHFRRRFRLSRSVFSRVVDCISSSDAYFIQKPDAADRPGLSAIQKALSAIRQLAYGAPADSMDEYVRMAETTALESLKRFCVAVVDSLGDEYLRAPTTQDLSRLLRIGEERGFPGMLGSLDCMHWRWKNCPKGWAGQFTGKEKAPTIVPEAVADYEGWMWHLFFGMRGTHNEINVLDRSHLFTDLTDERAPSVSYQINGTHYSIVYCLADGIYPPWAILVQTISNPQSKKKKFFAEAQESARKDVERAFGMLQSQYAILTRPCRLWSQEGMVYILKTCFILHLMAIKDEKGSRWNHFRE
uniref:F21J9.3 putative n=1 Tax=Albugo laibachii Nc14 TaxID=890382 RepID=F0WDN3_9STRA|nr:F21J9.3 putative [Albugo laibachii Nc14]|eukprot:CCA19309.1 F21J9.3 putative [Albugo laibachii Nc14]